MPTHATADFSFQLPDELIARYPCARRSGSRLLRLRAEAISHHSCADLPQLLKPSDLLVFNNTKVIPARLAVQKSTGGVLELLLERLLGERECLVQLRGARSLQPEAVVQVVGCEQCTLRYLERAGRFYKLSLESCCCANLLELFTRHGQVPLPPYLRRPAEAQDSERYQSLWAREPGAVAAPTASLHFDEPLLANLRARGLERVELTLHTGYGTFAPVQSQDLREHVMHSEYYSISAECAERINAAKAAGRRVIAIGTTVARALESSASAAGIVQASSRDTDIFIYPGFKFRVLDALFTNFHLSQSTLLMLVCALSGREAVLRAYNCAVAERYRFFSYGDAMLLEP